MLERELAKQFREAFLERFGDAFYYKIPDTKGLGGMRPFDALILARGKIFAVEFKRDRNEKLTKWQIYHLAAAARNGAETRIIHAENWRIILDEIGRKINERGKCEFPDAKNG